MSLDSDAYHVLSVAVAVFGKQPSELNPEQLNTARTRAIKVQELEDRVLSSAEAVRISVPRAAVDTALDRVRKRYEDLEHFEIAMRECALTQDDLRHALWRELTFDAVMNVMGEGVKPVTNHDIETFYANNRERFEKPELRTARHILITINPDDPDNTSEAARTRIEKLYEELLAHPENFAHLAAKNSECPSALDEGRLGRIPQGNLFPDVDAVLFHLPEGGIGGPVESEAGLHIVLCEKIDPGTTLPLSESRHKISTYLTQHRRKSKQQAWLDTLKTKTCDEG